MATQPDGQPRLPSEPTSSGTGSNSTGSNSTGSNSTGSNSTGSNSTGSNSTGSNSTGSARPTTATTGKKVWEPKPFKKGPWIVGGVGAMAVLTGAHQLVTRTDVEQALRKRATEKLSAVYPGAKVSFDGRDATISGVPAADEANAHHIVRHIEGVRHVREAGAAASSASSAAGSGATTSAAAADTTVAAPASGDTTAVTAAASADTTAVAAAPDTTTAPVTTEAAPATTAVPTTVAPPPTTEASPPTTVPATTAPAPAIAPASGAADAAASPPADRSGLPTALHFDSGSEAFDTDATSAVDQLAAYLTANPTVSLSLTGYADARGTRIGNLAVSRARVEAVRVALVGKGIAPNRLHAYWHGSRHPVGDNHTDAGRAANRRVEVRFLDTPSAREVSFTG